MADQPATVHVNDVLFTGTVEGAPFYSAVKGKTPKLAFFVRSVDGDGENAPSSKQRIVAWGDQAVSAEELIQDGVRVAITGRLKSSIDQKDQPETMISVDGNFGSIEEADNDEQDRNEVMVTGEVTGDIELFDREGKTPLLLFQVHVHQEFEQEKGDPIETNAYLPVCVWGGLAQDLHKKIAEGAVVSITEAQLRHRATEWEGRGRSRKATAWLASVMVDENLGKIEVLEDAPEGGAKKDRGSRRDDDSKGGRGSSRSSRDDDTKGGRGSSRSSRDDDTKGGRAGSRSSRDDGAKGGRSSGSGRSSR